ncbi:unnamed protein product [Didymodactylos carnosus]|uniref:Uncharacterized protein n=1 Tax=Didymodactylos carnosus TaxID=1234261 RepID=A0A813YGG3_9BILA|nr:unnamed protein product [Didymodactylos carnosus]CAF0883851.1 unnamed protein product [Didymodactylos carnosus]CAF3652548.1 unnamed protein product [Didymodactylos carnosus]CAF3669491.1 unnamed protein product [Didymodactylos carnosus]
MWDKSTTRIHILLFIGGIIFGLLISKMFYSSCSLSHISTNYLQLFKKNEPEQPEPEQRQPHQLKNGIFSAATNVSLVEIYRFVRSARSSCHACHIVLLVNDNLINTTDFLQLTSIYSVQFIPYHQSVTEYTSIAEKNLHIYFSRWIVFYRYLLHLKSIRLKFQNLFLCDMKDTVFQSNIFDYIPIDDQPNTVRLYGILESNIRTIGTCRFSGPWVRSCFDESEFQKLSNKSIACAGTVLGNYKGMMIYLTLMEKLILTKYTISGCKDQGIHNHIIHNYLVPNTSLIPHETGFVGTLGYSPWVYRNKFGLAINLNKSVYAVIHQFNRSPQMVDQYNREYQILSNDILERKA